MGWKLISDYSLEKIRLFLSQRHLLGEFESLGIKIGDYEGPEFNLIDENPSVEKLPCNCSAKTRDGELATYHSSECSSIYDNTAEGILAYEGWTGRRYLQ